MSPVQRQRRGLARMNAILDAATIVFARDGIERGTTNAIAAQAGISPGSLYQYYSNRDEILAAVLDRYINGLRGLYSELIQRLDEEDLCLSDTITLVVDPVLSYKRAHAVFGQIYARVSLPPAAQEALDAAHHDFAQRLVAALARRNPAVEIVTIERGVRQCIFMTRGMIDLLGHVHGDESSDATELKAAMAAYLTSLGLR